MKKVCNKCNKEKLLTEFSDLKQGKFGKRPECKECRNSWSKDYYNKNSKGILERQKAQRVRNGKYTSSYWRKKKYGLSEEDHAEMLKSQNGLCKICRKDDKLVVDHCHSTNKIRGLLCARCNKGLGHFLDNQELLTSAIKYLKGS
jgi:protein-arginine kinase activator protein McsA